MTMRENYSLLLFFTAAHCLFHFGWIELQLQALSTHYWYVVYADVSDALFQAKTIPITIAELFLPIFVRCE